MSPRTAKREYKLAADSTSLPGRPTMREILQITEDGRREVFLVVNTLDAMDVRDALARAYQDGREDRGSEDEPLEPRPVLHHPAPGVKPVAIDARRNH